MKEKIYESTLTNSESKKPTGAEVTQQESRQELEVRMGEALYSIFITMHELVTEKGAFEKDRRMLEELCNLMDGYLRKVKWLIENEKIWNPCLSTLIDLAKGFNLSLTLLFAAYCMDDRYYVVHLSDVFDASVVFTREDILNFVEKRRHLHATKYNEMPNFVLSHHSAKTIVMTSLVQVAEYFDMDLVELVLRLQVYKLTGKIDISDDDIETLRNTDVDIKSFVTGL